MTITPEEAAEMLGLSIQTIQKWLRSGKLKGSKVGNLWRIDPKDVRALLPERAKFPVKPTSEVWEVSFVSIGEGRLIVTTNGRPVRVIDKSQRDSAIRMIAEAMGEDVRVSVWVPAVEHGGEFEQWLSTKRA